MEDWKHAGRSLMNITNNRGPKTLPWGTPERMLHCSDCESPILTHWYRFLKYASSHFHSLPPIPKAVRVSSRWLCKTESNAFLKSMYMTSTSHLGSSTFLAKISSCWRVDLLGRNPNWCLEDLSLTCSIKLLYTILSKTLDKIHSNEIGL